MDNFVNELLKLPGWVWIDIGIALVTLLAFTDIPPSIINFIIRLIKAKELGPAENLSPLGSKAPTDRRKIPIAAILEKKSRRGSKYIRHKYIMPLLNSKKTSVSWLIKKLNEEDGIQSKSRLDFNFESFSSRSNNQSIGNSLITVLNGLPGTGKSTAILHWLDARLQENKMDLLIYFNSSEARSRYPSLIGGQNVQTSDSLWKDILVSIINNANDDFKILSPNLISYYINYGYCYILIDDVDNKNDLVKSIDLIKNYLKTYHKQNKNLKVILTTRNQQISDITNQLVTLEPLNKQDTDNFFYKKCGELGINLQDMDFYEIIDPKKQSILHFTNKYTQNPLFVEIVAFIIKKRGFKKLTETFQKSVAFVYREFIRTLCMKSDDEEFYDKFYSKYRILGYTAAKRNLNEFESGLIDECFGLDSDFSTDFLHTNGLLIRKNEGGKNVYSFIHLTIRDILYIDYIVTNDNYDVFEGATSIGDEFIYYLREEIKQLQQYCGLLRFNLVIGKEVLNIDFIEKISNGNNETFSLNVINTVLEYHVFENKIHLDENDIVSFIKEIPGSANYIKTKLLEGVRNRKHLNERAISILLRLGGTYLKDFFVKEILNDKYKSEFTSIINNEHPDVLNIFEDVLSVNKVNSQEHYKLLLFLLSSHINSNTRYSHWFITNANRYSLETLKLFFANKHIREKVFYPFYTYIDISQTRFINKALSDHIWGHVLVPQGTYQFNSKKISINKSFLIKIQPIKVLIKAKNNYEAEMAALGSVNIKLMTFDQLEVVYGFFLKSDGFDPHSIIGIGDGLLSGDYILYEAYKEHNNGKLHFAHLQNTNTGIVKQGSRETKFAENVIYRTFKYLD